MAASSLGFKIAANYTGKSLSGTESRQLTQPLARHGRHTATPETVDCSSHLSRSQHVRDRTVWNTDNFESHQLRQRQREVLGKEHVYTVCVYVSTVNTCGGWYRHVALHKSTHTWVQAHAAAPGPCSSPEHAHKANGCLGQQVQCLLLPVDPGPSHTLILSRLQKLQK